VSGANDKPAAAPPADVLLSWHTRAHEGKVIIWFSHPVDFLSLPREAALKMRDGIDKALSLIPDKPH